MTTNVEFSEKLKTLISLTSTKNNMIAAELNIDAAQISRLRTGARKMPRDPKLLRDISSYLSKRFEDEYRLSALFELTGDERLQETFNENIIADIIYDWLTATDTSEYTQSGSFFDNTGDFSNGGRILSDKMLSTISTNSNAFQIFLKNEGKRRAVNIIYDYILSLDKPCTFKLFSDESEDWLFEKPGFIEATCENIRKMTEKGVKVRRIFPPSRNLESSFRDTERWLPAYMAGIVRLYYYPWTRDELHRMTIYIVQGQIALFSFSLHGQHESAVTFIVSDPVTVTALDAYFDSILVRCRSMISFFTLSDSQRVLSRIKSLSQLMESGVYKSSRLSAHTLPLTSYDSLKSRASPFVYKVLEQYNHNQFFKKDMLRQFVITDIITLPRLENVLNGVEPVPGAAFGKDTLYYTAEEYRLHLAHIVWYLETYPNYKAVLVDENVLSNVVIYTKGNERALIIKESDPYALFEITEARFAAILSGYLKNFADDILENDSRERVIDRLKAEITRVDKATAYLFNPDR